MKAPSASRHENGAARVTAALRAGAIRLRAVRGAENAGRWAAVSAVAVATAQAIMLMAGAPAPWRRWALLAVPLAAAVAAAAAMLRRYPPTRAAAWLDDRLGLPQSLTTAAELLATGQDKTPSGGFAVQQAAEMLAGCADRTFSPWRASRRLGGAMLLACMVTLALAAPAKAPPPAADPAPRAAVEAALTGSPADALRRWAGQVQAADELLAGELRLLADAPPGQAHHADGMPLEQILAELQRLAEAGNDAAANARAALLEAIQPALPAATASALDGEGATAPPPAAWVPVHDPARASGEPAAGEHNAGDGVATAPPPASAWDLARRRAERAGRPPLPPEYRQLVRDYFSSR